MIIDIIFMSYKILYLTLPTDSKKRCGIVQIKFIIKKEIRQWVLKRVKFYNLIKFWTYFPMMTKQHPFYISFCKQDIFHYLTKSIKVDFLQIKSIQKACFFVWVYDSDSLEIWIHCDGTNIFHSFFLQVLYHCSG